MEKLESGKYLLSEDEVNEYGREAAFLRDVNEMYIDLSRPLDVGEAMFLSFARLILEGDRDTAERALVFFDEQILLVTNKH